MPWLRIWVCPIAQQFYPNAWVIVAIRRCFAISRSLCLGLNFQNRNGFVPPYQARQLIEMIVKYQGSAE